LEAFSRSHSLRIAVTRAGKALTAEEDEDEEEIKEVEVEVQEEVEEEEEEEDEKVGEEGSETRVSGASSKVLSSVTVSSRPVAFRVVDITELCPEVCV